MTEKGLYASWRLEDVARSWSAALEPPRWRWLKHREWRRTGQPEHMELKLKQLLIAQPLSVASFGFKRDQDR